MNNNQNQFYQPQVNPAYVQQMMVQNKIKQGKKAQRKEIVKVGFALGSAIIIYLIMQTIASHSLDSLGLASIYEHSSLFKYAFNVLAVHVFSMIPAFGILALTLKNNFITSIFPNEKVGKLKACAWVGFGMGASILGNIIVATIIQFSKKTLGYELTQNEMGGPESILSCVIQVISMAIVPAIFEEFAFRGCTLGVLRKYGKGFAVFSVSIVFGLIHGNMIQFLYAFLVGLALAYITVQTNNIVIAMLIHGFANGMSVVKDIVTYASNTKIGELTSNIVFYAWAIIGAISLAYLIVTKSFSRKKELKSLYDNSFGVKLLCLLPGLAIPFSFLIIITSQYINKV